MRRFTFINCYQHNNWTFCHFRENLVKFSLSTLAVFESFLERRPATFKKNILKRQPWVISPFFVNLSFRFKEMDKLMSDSRLQFIWKHDHFLSNLIFLYQLLRLSFCLPGYYVAILFSTFLTQVAFNQIDLISQFHLSPSAQRTNFKG